jgi:thiamine transport system ATP-binding protein
VLDALAQVGLSGFENRKPAELSGGQQSRVALARVLLQDKPLVLLDEPFSALGPAMRQEMLSLVQERLVANGRSVIFVTHDRQDAEQADQILIVTDGEISPPRLTQAVLSAPPDALTSYWGK